MCSSSTTASYLTTTVSTGKTYAVIVMARTNSTTKGNFSLNAYALNGETVRLRPGATPFQNLAPLAPPLYNDVMACELMYNSVMMSRSRR